MRRTSSIRSAALDIAYASLRGLFRSYNLRLAAFFTLAFALSVIVLGVVTLLNARAALTSQFNERILSDSNAMVQEFNTEGLSGITESIREHDLTPGALDFGLQSASGAPIAGNFARVRAHLGWSTVGVSDDVIEASWNALVDALRLELMRLTEANAGSSQAVEVRG